MLNRNCLNSFILYLLPSQTIKAMLKARTSKAIILGLSDENMKRLRSGQPIIFCMSELGMEKIDMVIFNGRTEKEMAEQILKIKNGN